MNHLDRWMSKTSPEWKSEDKYDSGDVKESMPERVASWMGMTLPKRVTIVQDLDSSTVFVLELCKIIPPEWIGLLAALGIAFLIVLGFWGLRLVWKLATRCSRARSRRVTPVSSVPKFRTSTTPGSVR